MSIRSTSSSQDSSSDNDATNITDTQSDERSSSMRDSSDTDTKVTDSTQSDEDVNNTDTTSSDSCASEYLPESLMSMGLRQTGPPPENTPSISEFGIVRVEEITTYSVLTDENRQPPGYAFLGKTPDGADARLTFGIDSPFRVADLIGKTFSSYTYQRMLINCLVSGGPGFSDEPMIVAHVTLRDGDGKLLMLRAPSAPTDPHGGLIMNHELTPEISVRWIEKPEESCENRRMALEFTVTASDQKTLAFPSERAELKIEGKSFTIAIYRVVKPEQGKSCGASEWTLYRQDLLLID